MLGEVIDETMVPAREWKGVRFWIRIEGVFKRSFQVYEVVGTREMPNGTVIYLEEYRTRYPHMRHEMSMEASALFKPFLIRGGKQ